MAQESWKCDQDETGCQPPEGPILCANNCGFFGSKATMNLCSKCYRDVVLSQGKVSTAKNALDQLPLLINNNSATNTSNSSAASAAAAADIIPGSGLSLDQSVVPVDDDDDNKAVLTETVMTSDVNSSSGGNDASTPVSAAEPSASRPPNRCFACNKRVGLTGFNCRCGNVYCALHRYSDKHNCTYDYKAVGRDAIAKANPVVKADKVDKI